MIVVVVIPFTVVETSLTTVLDELPLPPDPELPPADCEDEVADADEVDDVAEVDDVDVVDFAEDDAAALVGVAVTAAAEEAIALIDMKTSPEGTCGAQHRLRALFSPSTRGMREAGATRRKKAATLPHLGSPGSNQSLRHALQVLPSCPEGDQPAVGFRSP